jgi:hypothetical protein
MSHAVSDAMNKNVYENAPCASKTFLIATDAVQAQLSIGHEHAGGPAREDDRKPLAFALHRLAAADCL